MAQELSWDVHEEHKAPCKETIAKPFIEYGFVSGRSSWADATEEQQEKNEEKLWLPEELPKPLVDAVPALTAASRSLASTIAMAAALLLECATCE
eukprot:1233513-Karenia_brevis.AAC.1